VKAPHLYLTRAVEFSAAHRLFREDWSDSKNFEIFGKCANRFGHGHNYNLEVTILGEPEMETGLVLHYDAFKKCLLECVIIPLDHHNLNEDVDFMKGIQPTSENIIVQLWNRLSEALHHERFSLYKLRLSSTNRSSVEYYGETRK